MDVDGEVDLTSLRKDGGRPDGVSVLLCEWRSPEKKPSRPMVSLLFFLLTMIQLSGQLAYKNVCFLHFPSFSKGSLVLPLEKEAEKTVSIDETIIDNRLQEEISVPLAVMDASNNLFTALMLSNTIVNQTLSLPHVNAKSQDTQKANLELILLWMIHLLAEVQSTKIEQQLPLRQPSQQGSRLTLPYPQPRSLRQLYQQQPFQQ